MVGGGGAGVLVWGESVATHLVLAVGNCELLLAPPGSVRSGARALNARRGGVLPGPERGWTQLAVAPLNGDLQLPSYARLSPSSDASGGVGGGVRSENVAASAQLMRQRLLHTAVRRTARTTHGTCLHV